MKKFHSLVVVIAIVLFNLSIENVAAQKASNDAVKIGGIKFPYKFKYEGNPVSRLHSAADPDAQVYNGELWVYTSQDRNVDSSIHKAHYDAMDGYHAFSTSDMINWTDHGEIFHSSDVSWAWEKGGFLWAPGSAFKNGKYYLYYPIKDKQGNWRVGVATGNSPKGPFTDSGKPIDGLGGIDPKIFIDEDGEAYLYNNPAVVAKLKPNMIELAEKPRKIVYASPEIMENDTLKFKEGAYLHKRNGIYYFSYTNWKNKTSQGFYATANNPYGPFEWKGEMAPRPVGAQDHHSIIEFKNQWYYFYHIALKDMPKFKESQGRIMCYDKLFYNPDGTIKMVNHTR
jgi:beta-xylosidase